MKIRPLSHALQERAEKELNEVPSQIEENLAHIKEWLSKQAHIKYKDDDQFIVNFLRSSKFSLERTKQKLDAFYTFRTLAPEIAQNLDPLLPEVQAVLSVGLCATLKLSEKGSADPRVYIVRNGNYDPDSVSFLSMLKVAAISINIDINEDDNFVISGVKVVWDLKGLQVKTATQMTPSAIKKAVYMFQTSYPSRLKSVHFVNVPKFMEPPIAMLKLISSKKFGSRLFFHPTNNFDEIYKDIPRAIMPKEYGGEAESVNDIMADWKSFVEDHREMLLNEDNFYTDESKRPGQGQSIESVFGIDGSFRKLEVD